MVGQLVVISRMSDSFRLWNEALQSPHNYTEPMAAFRLDRIHHYAHDLTHAKQPQFRPDIGFTFVYGILSVVFNTLPCAKLSTTNLKTVILAQWAAGQFPLI